MASEEVMAGRLVLKDAGTGLQVIVERTRQRDIVTIAGPIAMAQILGEVLSLEMLNESRVCPGWRISTHSKTEVITSVLIVGTYPLLSA